MDAAKRRPAFLYFCLWLAAAPAAAQEWERISPVTCPESREGEALVYDPVRQHLLLWGGIGLDPLADTWSLAGDVWTELHPAHAPIARGSACAFWDEQRQRVVLFGGSSHGVIDRDTIWTWDGTDWSSTMPTSLIVPGRRDASATWDSTRQRIVLFGGVVDGSPDVSLADTWEYDGSGWSQVVTATTPPDRGWAPMGYDPARQITVMMGGMSQTASLLSDTWIYDGQDWSEAPDAGTPATSSQLKMTWDPIEQKLMLAGQSDVYPLQAWHFDGSRWIEHSASDINPSGIDEPSLAFDASRGYALYLHTGNQRLQGYSVSPAGEWTRILPVPEPAGVDIDRGGLLHDTRAGQLRLFGETLGGGLGFVGWGWDGDMWRLLELAGADQVHTPVCLAHDAGRGTTVAFNGLTYELTDQGWVLRPSAELPRSNGAMAYDAGRGTVVYFGGILAFEEYDDRTWEWDGSGWRLLSTATAPPGRWQAAMAYDARRGRLVLFGGMGMVSGNPRYLLDTWELVDGDWRQVDCEGPATLRDTPVMTYDAKRQRVVLWAAQDYEDAQVWEFDGHTWSGTPPPPEQGDEGLIGYDPIGERLVLHLTTGSTWVRPSTPAAESDGGSGDGGTGDGDGSSDCGCAAGPPSADLLLLLVLLPLGLRRRRAASGRRP